MQPAIHELAVIQPLADERQVFENNDRILEATSVFNSLPRRFLHDVRQGVLVVVESLVNPPVGVTLLKTAKRGEHLFAEVSCPPAVEQHRLNWSIILAGTAPQEFGFTDIEANRSWVVRHVWLRDHVLDSNVQDPVLPVFLQSELADRHVVIEQVRPQLPLSGVDTKRNPESVATPRLWNAPTELVRSVVGVVDIPSLVRESNRMVVSISEA
jgi:hypothetical protein